MVSPEQVSGFSDYDLLLYREQGSCLSRFLGANFVRPMWSDLEGMPAAPFLVGGNLG